MIVDTALALLGFTMVAGFAATIAMLGLDVLHHGAPVWGWGYLIAGLAAAPIFLVAALITAAVYIQFGRFLWSLGMAHKLRSGRTVGEALRRAQTRR